MTDYYVFIVEAAVSSLISSTRSQSAALCWPLAYLRAARNASMPVLLLLHGRPQSTGNTIIRSKSGQKNAHAAHKRTSLGVVGLFPLIIKIP
jgi:hypothetical protein